MSSMGDSHKILDILHSHFTAGGIPLDIGCEIGCHRGALSAKLLCEFPSLMLAMIDSWDAHPKSSPYYQTGDSLSRLTFAQQTAHMEAAKAATEFAHNRRMILRLPSVKAAQRVPFPRINFVFLDDDHSEPGVRSGLAAWWPRIEGGGRGLIAVHDYSHPRNDRQLFGVKVAFDEFVAANGLELKTLGSIAWAVKGGKPNEPLSPQASSQAPARAAPPSLDMGTELV